MRYALLFVCAVTLVQGHGRLLEPPGRSSAWRFGFNTPRNDNDNQLYCGGFQVQKNNGGKCGVCGDPYNGVRDNEAGGKYATGTIVRNYTVGQVIQTTAQLTANHRGWFEYRICPHNDVSTPVTHECLNQHILERADGQGQKLTIPGGIKGNFTAEYKLPDDIVCTQCVIQWKYHAGNTWGTDPDGHSCTGCGPQEEFYGCADVSILPPGGSSGAVPIASPTTTIPITRTDDVTTTQKQMTSSHGVASHFQNRMVCKAIGSSAGDPYLDRWCTDTCSVSPSSCPEDACKCSSVQIVTSVTSTTKPDVTFTYSHCVTNGVVDGDYWQRWCQSQCDLGYCASHYCTCT